MEKKEFIYRNVVVEYLWFFVLGIPCASKLVDVLQSYQGAAFLVMNAILSLLVVYALWRLIDLLPGTMSRGYYYREDGYTVIEYGKLKILLDGVTELYLSEKRLLNKGVNLMIANHEEKLVFLSQGIRKDVDVKETTFYNLFVHVLNENNGFTQVKDVMGNPIENWYKK